MAHAMVVDRRGRVHVSLSIQLSLFIFIFIFASKWGAPSIAPPLSSVLQPHHRFCDDKISHDVHTYSMTKCACRLGGLPSLVEQGATFHTSVGCGGLGSYVFCSRLVGSSQWLRPGIAMLH